MIADGLWRRWSPFVRSQHRGSGERWNVAIWRGLIFSRKLSPRASLPSSPPSWSPICIPQRSHPNVQKARRSKWQHRHRFFFFFLFCCSFSRKLFPKLSWLEIQLWSVVSFPLSAKDNPPCPFFFFFLLAQNPHSVIVSRWSSWQRWWKQRRRRRRRKIITSFSVENVQIYHDILRGEQPMRGSVVVVWMCLKRQLNTSERVVGRKREVIKGTTASDLQEERQTFFRASSNLFGNVAVIVTFDCGPGHHRCLG